MLRADNLTLSSCDDYLETFESRPPGTLRACPDLYWDYFIFLFCFVIYVSKQQFTRIYMGIVKYNRETNGDVSVTVTFVHCVQEDAHGLALSNNFCAILCIW